MKSDQLYELQEKVCKELDRYAQKDLTATSLEIVDKLAHAGKNIGKLIEMCEEDDGGYSSRGYSYYRGVEPGRDTTYHNSYARGRRNAPRDSMGRYSGNYSGHDDFTAKLRDMMSQAPDEQTKRELERIASQMDR